MSLAAELIGQTFKTTIYKSVVGSIVMETEILTDGTISSSLWVVFPDGVGQEVFTVEEAEEKLEL